MTVTATPGIVGLDTFPGATDEAKLDSALAHVAAQTYKPTIQFPDRKVIFSKTRQTFTGMKFIGPGPAFGCKNLEIDGGKPLAGKVQLNVGIGDRSWLVGSGSVYDLNIGSAAFQAGNPSAQFIHHPTGTLYACEFSNLNLYGFKHAFGMPSAKCLMTQVVFSGHWTVIGSLDTAFTMGGSDCALWMGGYCNITSGGGGAGKFQMILDSMQKLDVGKVYITADKGWRGVWVKSGALKANFWGGEYEGRNADTPCDGNLFRIDGGNVGLFGVGLGYGMANPASNEHGIIEVNGGDVHIDRPYYWRGKLSASVPLVYVYGGHVNVSHVAGAGGPFIAKRAGGGTLNTDTSMIVR